MRYIINQVIFILMIGYWLMNPCSAATAQHQQHVAKQHHVVTKATRHHGSKTTRTNHLHTHSHKAKTKKVHKKIVPKRVRLPNDRTTLSEEMPVPMKEIAVSSKPGFFSSIEERLVNFVHTTVATLRYSSYKLGGRQFDPSRGVYIVDCSEYVDHILEEVYPNSYSSLVDTTGSEKPTSMHYYDFFSRLSEGHNHYWNKIDDVEELQAGDILVFRSGASGHVMVVMDKPIQDDNAYLVRVADSAPSGHSEDTRPKRVSGIGIGTLLLKANPRTGEPSAYAWKVGARWTNNVRIAMARPVGRYN